jgi:hypothetical protein
MSAAKRDVPHFYAAAEIDAEPLGRLRDELRARGGEWERLTVTHLLLKAVGLALREVPEMNASWADDAVILHDEANIGLATAVGDGLLVPVVRGCDRRPLVEIVARAVGWWRRTGRVSVPTTCQGHLHGFDRHVPVARRGGVTNRAAVLAVGAIRAAVVLTGTWRGRVLI